MKLIFSKIIVIFFIFSVLFYSCQSSDFDQLYFTSNFEAWVKLDSGTLGAFRCVSDSQDFDIDTLLKNNRVNLRNVNRIIVNKVNISTLKPTSKPIPFDSLIEIKLFAQNNEDTIRIAELDSVLKTNIVSNQLVLNPTLQSIKRLVYPEDSLKLILDARIKGGVKVKHEYLIKIDYQVE
ncbi:MAG: hypothetical protein OHK0038_26460 [Flammeovirgaceae bacterium]